MMCETYNQNKLSNNNNNKIAMEKCDQCEYTANKRCSVYAHKLHVHDGKMNECDQCDKNFSRKPNLRRHVYFVHDKTNKTKCDQCDYEAYDETAIKHCQRHNGPRV